MAICLVGQFVRPPVETLLIHYCFVCMTFSFSLDLKSVFYHTRKSMLRSDRLQAQSTIFANQALDTLNWRSLDFRSVSLDNTHFVLSVLGNISLH